jgi:cellulose synthase/poly-beta-1,6-N-acetylglucosamine synthase-like glycosyltransferase
VIGAAIALVAAIIALGLLAATSAFALQAFASAFLPDRRPRVAAARPACVVLVPAHDEAAGIARTVRSLLAEAAPGDRILVVADNCSDDTAAVARAAGAEVMERNDPGRRGKGHALAAALRKVRDDGGAPPAMIVFVDADCAFDPGALDLLVRTCAAAGSPVQCRNLMIHGEDQPQASRLAEFAWRVRNDFRPGGYRRLGLPCPLFGTGMAMPFVLAAPERFDTGHVTEDLLIGVEAALSGAPPVYLREASLFSRFPDAEAGTVQQKRRWVHGHLAVIASHAPRLLRAAIARRDHRLFWMGMDLLTPPLALLGIALALGCLSTGVIHLVVGAWTPLMLAGAACLAYAVSLIGAWFACGRDLIGWREIGQLPRHALQVGRAAIGFVTGDRSGWVRADRSRSR